LEASRRDRHVFSKRCKEEPQKLEKIGKIYSEFRTLLGKTQDIIMEDK